MIIIETCPKCGHDLHDLVIATYPPIPKKECWSCGWSWTGKPEEVVRMPFGGNSINMMNNNYYKDFLNAGYSEEDSCTLANVAMESAIAYNGMIDITDATNSLIDAFNNANSTL